MQVCIEPEEKQGGLYRYVTDFAALAPAGTVALRRAAPPHPRPSEISIGVGTLGLTPYRRHVPALAAKALAEAIKNASHVVCHSLYRGHVTTLAEICRARSIPYSIVAHGMLDPWTLSRFRWLKEIWLRRGGRQAIESATHLLFTTSREMEKAMPAVPGHGRRFCALPSRRFRIAASRPAEKPGRNSASRRTRDFSSGSAASTG